jgi:phage terminase large subunit-like protein
LDDSKIIKKPGIPYAIDRAQVKHVSGGYSSIQFFSFDQGREKFQGSSVHRVWIDEEPPNDIYNECRMRVLDTNGIIVFTFTPLGGVTELYDSLLQDDSVEKFWLTVDDVSHLDPEALARLYSGMSEAEKQARKYGVATIGTGKVFQFEESEYITEDFEIPRHWRRIGGLDVGLSHPTAAVALAIDDESGCYYIYQEYCKGGAAPRDHCIHLSMWNIEFAMDPTAWNRQIGSQESVAKMYEKERLRVFKAFHDVDPSVAKIRGLICEGRLWIFQSCTQLLKELRTYRTREGADGKQKIIKINDDLVDSFRYSIMASAKASIMGKNTFRSNIKVVEWQPSGDHYSGY